MSLHVTPQTTHNKSPLIAAAQAVTLSTYGALPVTGFVRQPAVLACVPFSSATLWRKCKEGKFPSPVKLSERVTAWKSEDIRQWLAEQGAQA